MMGKLQPSGPPNHTIRVTDKEWSRWRRAAEAAGVGRNKFIVTVVNNAAHQILESQRKEEQDEPL